MRDFFREYFLFIFYSLISIIVINIFFFAIMPTNNGEDSIVTSIINEEHLNQSMIDEAVNQGHGNTDNLFGFFETIDEVNVYFNVKGKTLPYATHYEWKDYIVSGKDENGNWVCNYKNADGTENMEDEHCLAEIKYYNVKTGQMRKELIDLTNYVTPANYTNEHPVPTFDYLNETPTEQEAQIEVVPYILNWENIHIKRNVSYFILPKKALMTFTGRAVNTSNQPFVLKRIIFYKGDIEIAETTTNANGEFVMGIGAKAESTSTSSQSVLPLGQYKFVVDLGESKYSITYPENRFDADDGESKTFNLGNITFN